MKHLLIFLYVCLGIFLALLAFVTYSVYSSMDDISRYQSNRVENKVNVIVGKSNRGMGE